MGCDRRVLGKSLVPLVGADLAGQDEGYRKQSLLQPRKGRPSSTRTRSLVTDDLIAVGADAALSATAWHSGGAPARPSELRRLMPTSSENVNRDRARRPLGDVESLVARERLITPREKNTLEASEAGR